MRTRVLPKRALMVGSLPDKRCYREVLFGELFNRFWAALRSGAAERVSRTILSRVCEGATSAVWTATRRVLNSR